LSVAQVSLDICATKAFKIIAQIDVEIGYDFECRTGLVDNCAAAVVKITFWI